MTVSVLDVHANPERTQAVRAMHSSSLLCSRSAAAPAAAAAIHAGIAENSHLRKQNYFYYNCITGHFLRDNCPSYLREDNFNRLKEGLINRLTISTGFFLDELRARKYSKVGTWDVGALQRLCRAGGA